jgi:uncharacterized protein YcfL
MKNNFKLCKYLLVLFSLVGCNNSSSSIEDSSKFDSSIINESSFFSNSSESTISLNESSFKTKIESTLIDGEDYINHINIYEENFEYDDSMWYINKLDKVPFPDPHVFVEDDVYYIIGTNDPGSCRYVDCYMTTDFVDFTF